MPSLSHLPETIPFIHPFQRSSKFGDESQCEVDNVGSCLLLGLLKFLWPKICTAWRSSQPSGQNSFATTGIGVPGRCRLNSNPSLRVRPCGTTCFSLERKRGSWQRRHGQAE